MHQLFSPLQGSGVIKSVKIVAPQLIQLLYFFFHMVNINTKKPRIYFSGAFL